jgi:hypothetical protein
VKENEVYMNNSGFADKLRGDITGAFQNTTRGIAKTGQEANRLKAGGNKIPKGYDLGQLQQFTPEQLEMFKSLFPFLSEDSDLARLAGGDEEAFQEMEAPAYRDFNSLISGIANRFGTPSGGGQAQLGARKGSGFQNTLTAAGSNFAQDLQSRRQDLKRQALNDLMGYSNTLLQQRPTEKFLAPKPQKQGQTDWMSPVIRGGTGALVGGLTGGWGGAAAGAANGVFR